MSEGRQLTDHVKRDAAQIIRTVTSATKYLHDQGIVHRGEHMRLRWTQFSWCVNADLKPENILFKSKAEDADLMLADFGVGQQSCWTTQADMRDSCPKCWMKTTFRY